LDNFFLQVRSKEDQQPTRVINCHQQQRREGEEEERALASRGALIRTNYRFLAISLGELLKMKFAGWLSFVLMEEAKVRGVLLASSLNVYEKMELELK